MSACPYCGATWEGDTRCHAADCGGWPMQLGHERRATRCPPQAEKVVACGAPPLAPEGQGDPYFCLGMLFSQPHTRAMPDAMVRAALRAHAQAADDLADFASKENAHIAMERAIAAALDASVEAGPSRGATAPLAPEGISLEEIGRRICRRSAVYPTQDGDLVVEFGGMRSRLALHFEPDGKVSAVTVGMRDGRIVSEHHEHPADIGTKLHGQSDGAAPSPTPEGITAQAMVADAMEGELRRQIADLQSTIKHARQQHAEASEKHAAEYHRIATALGCHVHDDLAAKAAEARAALATVVEAHEHLIAHRVGAQLGVFKAGDETRMQDHRYWMALCDAVKAGAKLVADDKPMPLESVLAIAREERDRQSSADAVTPTPGDHVPRPTVPLDAIIWHADGIDAAIYEDRCDIATQHLVAEELRGIHEAVAALRARAAPESLPDQVVEMMALAAAEAFLDDTEWAPAIRAALASADASGYCLSPIIAGGASSATAGA